MAASLHVVYTFSITLPIYVYKSVAGTSETTGVKWDAQSHYSLDLWSFLYTVKVSSKICYTYLDRVPTTIQSFALLG